MRSTGGALSALTVAAALLLGACGDSPASVAAADAEPEVEDALAPGWQQLPPSPLAPRQGAAGVWTGSEVLVVGGSEALCPPNASCPAPVDPAFSDGAAFDPEAQAWRAIEPAPVPVMRATAAVAAGDAYFWMTSPEPVLLRYRIDDDTWNRTDLPAGVGASHRMTALGDRLLFYGGSDEAGEVADIVFDPAAGAVEELPPDPLSPSYDRTIAVSGDDLFLFAKDLVAEPSSAQPSLVRTARYRPAAGTWEQLATSQSLDGSTAFAAGDGRFVFPTLGGADGGAVNNWGRSYPYGAIYDAATDTWSDLPPAPGSASAAGAVGADGALYVGTAGLVLDVEAGAWTEMAPIPGDTAAARNVITAGRRAFVFGGARWARPEGELLGDAWLWQPGGAPAPEPAAEACAEPGTETDLSDEPVYDDVERWTNAEGCPVRVDVLVTSTPGPDFHCAPWPPSLNMGTPLGARVTGGNLRSYVRDPDGLFGDPELQAGFAADVEPAAGAVDTGYRQGAVELWMDPADDAFVYLVDGGTAERWPKVTQAFGCA